MNLKGNKGEWSELYAFFRLLDEGQLFSADQNLIKTSSFLDVDSIFRDDNGDILKYKVLKNGMIEVVDCKSKSVIMKKRRSEIAVIADDLLIEIKKLRGNCIDPFIEKKIKDLKVNQVKTKAQKKGDIKMLVYDSKNGLLSEQEFSIKSFLGSDPTLFNANTTTNIIYKLTDKTGAPISPNDISKINSIDNPKKYIKRINEILNRGYEISFHSYCDDTFYLNLQLIDSDLPEILAHIVLEKYVNKVTKIEDIIDNLNTSNPLNYNLTKGHNFYEYKLVNFLVEAALGMTSKTVWTGDYAVIGGLIIVKSNAEVVCYHLADFNKFKYYLKQSCRLDNPSGSRYGYGEVYSDKGETFIKLNFQFKA